MQSTQKQQTGQGIAVNVHDLDAETAYTVQPHEAGRDNMDRSMVAEVRKIGDVVTCGRFIYCPSHLDFGAISQERLQRGVGR